MTQGTQHSDPSELGRSWSVILDTHEVKISIALRGCFMSAFMQGNQWGTDIKVSRRLLLPRANGSFGSSVPRPGVAQRCRYWSELFSSPPPLLTLFGGVIFLSRGLGRGCCCFILCLLLRLVFLVPTYSTGPPVSRASEAHLRM
jgi:hypothetical protein